MKKIKIITILFVMGFTAYPVGELTRCIISYNILRDFGDYPFITYYLELALIWNLYLAIPFLLNKSLNLIWRIGRSSEG